MALYEELRSVDLVAPMLHLLRSKQYLINLDGKFDAAPGRGYNEDTPWLHARFPCDRKCNLWSKIMFGVYRIVPKGCFDCWKVVTKPRNLKEAMKMREMQVEMDIPAKVGMEKRDYTENIGGWGAFWYCPLDGGLAGARKHHAMVEKAVHKEIAPDLDVFLKRACTELEMGLGPTENWEYPKEWEMLENLIEAAFEPFPDAGLAPKLLDVHVIRTWIDYAAAYGDKTYLDYVDEPFTKGYVQYNGSIHADKDYEPITGKELLNEQSDNAGHLYRKGESKAEAESSDRIPEAITLV